jgi:hypothetical protein
MREENMTGTPSNWPPAATREDIEAIVEQVVDQRLAEWFGDPDEGLELRPEVVQRLREQKRRVAASDLGVPMEEVVRSLGIN